VISDSVKTRAFRMRARVRMTSAIEIQKLSDSRKLSEPIAGRNLRIIVRTFSMQEAALSRNYARVFHIFAANSNDFRSLHAEIRGFEREIQIFFSMMRESSGLSTIAM